MKSGKCELTSHAHSYVLFLFSQFLPRVYMGLWAPYILALIVCGLFWQAFAARLHVIFFLETPLPSARSLSRRVLLSFLTTRPCSRLTPFSHSYYLYPPSDLEKKPFLLVPALQLQAFLDKINGQLGTELGLSPPSVAAEVVIRFENNNTRRPRFLGISTSHSSYQDLTNAIPAKTFRPLGEPLLWPKPSETDLEAWEETLKLAHRTVAGKGTHKNKKKTKKKKGAGKMDAQQGGKQLEQTQQYLGLRQLIEQDEQAPVLVRALALPPLALNLSAPFPPHDAVVFVSIDIETYERNHSLITEIGIASLDTLDLARLPPGDNGTNWISKIRARHFRVQEHGHLHNTDFVQGCPDRFEFGESEWVSIVSAESIIASYIRSLCTIPESGETSTPRRFAEAVLGCVTEAQGLRNVVILGHSIDGDIATLKELGFDVQTLEFLEGTFDVAIMDRYMRGDTQKRSLGSILHDLGLTGWYLHNAGNDAVYALQVLLGLALRYDGREGKGKGEEGEAQEADRQVTDKKDGQATAKEDVDAHRKAKAEAKQEDDDEKEIVFKGRQSRGDKEVVKGKQNEEQQGIDEVEGGFEKDDEGKDKLVGKSEAGDDVKEGSQGDKLQTKVKVEEEQVDDKAKEGHKGEDEVNKKEPVKIKVEGEPKIEKQTEGGQAEVKEEKEGGDKVKEEVKKEGKTDEEAPKQATKATTEPTTAGPTALPPAAETPAAAATEQAADDSSSISSGSDGGVALPPGYWDSPAAQQTHILFAPSDLREDDLDDKDDSDSD